jgi:hypothetical protein
VDLGEIGGFSAAFGVEGNRRAGEEFNIIIFFYVFFYYFLLTPQKSSYLSSLSPATPSCSFSMVSPRWPRSMAHSSPV